MRWSEVSLHRRDAEVTQRKRRKEGATERKRERENERDEHSFSPPLFLSFITPRISASPQRLGGGKKL
jgi:hypothetical protein